MLDLPAAVAKAYAVAVGLVPQLCFFFALFLTAGNGHFGTGSSPNLQLSRAIY